MADTNEEQLLSDLLRRVANEDARLDAAHLEARVMAAADPGSRARSTSRAPYWVVCGIAAAVMMTVGLRTTVWSVPDSTGEAVRTSVATEVTIAATPDAIAQAPRRPHTTRVKRGEPLEPATPDATPPVTGLAIGQPVAGPVAVAPPVAQPPVEFVPLLPMTAQELTGPFQIVRVQMPSASLGPLRSPLQHPNELVEADVLLGEDGTARAIRVSTSGSVYPWRSK